MVLEHFSTQFVFGKTTQWRNQIQGKSCMRFQSSDMVYEESYGVAQKRQQEQAVARHCGAVLREEESFIYCS